MVTNVKSKPSSLASLESFKDVLDRIGPDSCPYQYNFHMHTQFSDGQMSPTQVIEQALKLKLTGLAITDHHSVAGYRMARQLVTGSDLTIWPGVEISCRLLGCEVHILGYAFDPNADSLLPYLQGYSVVGAEAVEVIPAIQAAGGLAVLAHPCRYGRSAAELVAAAGNCGIDGLEVFYSYRNSDPWRPSPHQTELVEALAHHYGLYKTCGTDSHGSTITRRI